MNPFDRFRDLIEYMDRKRELGKTLIPFAYDLLKDFYPFLEGKDKEQCKEYMHIIEKLAEEWSIDLDRWPW